MREDRGHTLVGTLLEQRYRVDALLARGGMSAVYRGLDTRLDRPVAIKVMDPRFAADPAFVDRFEREARSAAKIHHPNVVAVHDQGLDDDHVFLVDGGTLRDLLTERGALGVPLAVSIMESVLAALAAAHRAGLVHRDVKPENVLIGSNGTVKVGDFGLVRAIASAGTTSSSVILGTVAYLSPEQVTTGTATARGDVYSAGILLYEMLTGSPPYIGDTPLSIAYRHVNDDVPTPSAGLPQPVPPAIDDLVLRATRRDPAARPLDGGAFLIDLERVRATVPVPRVPVPVPRYHQVDLTVPVSAEDQARALGLDPPAEAGPMSGQLQLGEVAVLPVSSATTVSRIPTGFKAMGPQGTRAMLRPDLDQAAPPDLGMPPLLTAPPPPVHPPRPPYGPPTGGHPVQRPPKPPARRSSRIVLLSVVGVLLLAALGTTTWWFAAGRWTAIPGVDGLDQTSAEKALTDADLKVEVVKQRDDQIAAGKVIRSEPAAGAKALRGDQVRLVVSAGLPTVPDVRPGTGVDQAKQAVTDAELTPVTDDGKNEYDDTVPKGAVLRLDPKPGTQLKSGTRVTVIVSRGPKPKPVPDVRGQSRDDAFKTLSDNGFQPYDKDEEFSQDVDGGKVARTDPPAGKEPGDDKRVGVVLSNAVTMPDLGNHTVGDARSTLEGLGLQVDVQQVGPGNDNSRVFGQSPSAGSRVQPGSKVTLFAFL